MRLAYPQLLQASFTWILLGGGETVVFLTVFSHFLLRLCWLAGWLGGGAEEEERNKATKQIQ